MKLEDLKLKLRDFGVIGAGGAGFPTYGKLNPGAEVVILNSAECEPLLRGDRQLVQYYTEDILQGLSIVIKALKAEKGIFAIKSEYKQAIASLKAIIHKYPEIEIKILDNVYPAGDEVVLVYEVTGKIVPEASIPMAVGAVVINVETALNIYKAAMLNKPVTEKYVTVTGAVNAPITIKVPVGTSFEKCIELAGGASIKNYKIIAGGPMTGRVADIRDFVTKTTNAILLLPEEHLVIQRKLARSSVRISRAMSVCSQCRMCTDLCPRHLLGHNIQPHRIMNAIANGVTSDLEAYTLSFLCSGCGICENYACHQGLAPTSIIGELKNKLRDKGVKNPHNNKPDKVQSMREGRRVPMSRLVARLGLTKYNVNAPLCEESKNITSVYISMRQHIGASAIPKVTLGQKVENGEVIGEVEEGKLGANIHASISGIVTSIDNKGVKISG